MTIETIQNGHVTMPKGFLAGAVSAGIKTRAGALDLCLLYSERECTAAGMFTQNLVKGAPVVLTAQNVSDGKLRAIVANSGNSNSLNGPGGMEDARQMVAMAASTLGLNNQDVAVCSTGITGVRMPMAKVRTHLPTVSISAEGGHDLAEAIMTTDTRPKQIAVSVSTANGSYSVAGCSKGSGMIHPNMATMFTFVTTDAVVELECLRGLQREVAGKTLNMISVDGDTSCSDTFLVLANGAAGLPRIESGTPEAQEFQEALLTVCTHLARELARDGEGARHLIEVAVTGATTLEGARAVARTVSTSPLVKTAVAGYDPNWGRILVAAGRAGAPLEEAKVSMSLQGELIFQRGLALPFDEPAMSKKLESEEVKIEIDLGLGEASATAWGCDLTTDYVHINADYRT
jgi:glutamate N-acetyltransferase / amino-acid N-acetyltransferase